MMVQFANAEAHGPNGRVSASEESLKTSSGDQAAVRRLVS